MIKITRYKNRKMYRSGHLVYVNLPQLLKWVREGESVIVVDKETKNNVTERMLLAALTQEAEKGRVSLAEIEQFIREV